MSLKISLALLWCGTVAAVSAQPVVYLRAVVNLGTNTVTSLLTPNMNPSGLAISPDNTYAFITSFNDSTPVLAKVDLTQRQGAINCWLSGIIMASRFRSSIGLLWRC
jgi:hypothetical protein